MDNISDISFLLLILAGHLVSIEQIDWLVKRTGRLKTVVEFADCGINYMHGKIVISE